MRGSRNILPALAAVAIGMSVVAPGAASASSCGPAPLGPLAFKPSVFIDTARAGGEPVSVVADDGSIVVSTHRGTTHLYLHTAPEAQWYTQYMDQVFVWRSTDDGATWNRVEAIPGVSAHTVTSNGFSDPDLTRDTAGTLYGTELGTVNISVFSSRDNGATWPQGNPVAEVGDLDRPWVAGRGPGEVYLKWTGGLAKSSDGGATWERRTPTAGLGRIAVDPSDPNGLFNPYSGGLQVSRDDGQSWISHDILRPMDFEELSSVGVDRDGWAYESWTDNGAVRFSAFDPASSAWLPPVTIPHAGSGTPFWPWTIAGDAGRAAVGWYEATPVAPGPDPFNETATYSIRAFVAVTTDAHGSSTACPDGSTMQTPARFSVADAIGRPIHVGAFPCQGLGCNVSDLGGDRRLGDFFTINFDRAGRVFVTTGDTTSAGVAGLPNQVSRPLFAIADDASPRLTAP